MEFALNLQSEPDGTPESEYIPQKPDAKKLWEIRTRAIASGMRLLNEAEIEQELAEGRGGYLES